MVSLLQQVAQMHLRESIVRHVSQREGDQQQIMERRERRRSWQAARDLSPVKTSAFGPVEGSPNRHRAQRALPLLTTAVAAQARPAVMLAILRRKRTLRYPRATSTRGALRAHRRCPQRALATWITCPLYHIVRVPTRTSLSTVPRRYRSAKRGS